MAVQPLHINIQTRLRDGAQRLLCNYMIRSKAGKRFNVPCAKMSRVQNLV